MFLYLECIVFVQVVPQQLQMQEYRIDTFKRHGRWRSETAKDGYVKDSLSSRLQVSCNIGL